MCLRLGYTFWEKKTDFLMTDLKPPLQLDSPLTELSGVGPKRAESFASAFGIRRIGQLLCLIPSRYEEPAVVTGDQDLSVFVGQKVRITATVVGLSIWSRGRRRSVMTVRLVASNGQKILALFFNQAYRKNQFPTDLQVQLEGPLTAKNGLQLVSPRVVPDGEESPRHLQPIYPQRDPLASTTVKRAIEAAYDWLEAVEEPLPTFVLELAGVPDLPTALHNLHKPASLEQAESARRRLALGEVLNLEHRRLATRSEVGAMPLPEDDQLWQRIFKRLPFELNAEQLSVIRTLRSELQGKTPMRRLLHGEVGSGKTAVAFALALAVVAGGGQVALLAPTEILARQHLATFRTWLKGARLQVVGLFGDDRVAARRESLAALRTGRAAIAIGTHALFSADVSFKSLRLVLLDEQHRFGVKQKAALVSKGDAPHVLTMTATPIPRTLAWAQYGSLDPCILRTRAGANAHVTTEVHGLNDWQQVATQLRARIESGGQAFVVVPHIDGDDGLLAWQQRFLQGPWSGISAAMVHGRLPGEETAAIVERFRRGELDVLFGTTVVEVGLDIPAIEFMFIMNAERLGFASLHQLRGRLAGGNYA